MAQEYDAIIIGGGHNGLVTAGYLAKAGLKVIVLERRHVVGGAVVTEELIPGYKSSTASQLGGLLKSKIINDLELERFGFKIYRHDPTNMHLFPDGRYLMNWLDKGKTRKEIEKFSKKDAEAFFEMERFFDRYAEIIKPLELAPPPSFAELASRFKTPEEEEGFRKILMMSIKDFLDDRFESDEVKASIAPWGVVGTAAGPMSPGTVYMVLHYRSDQGTGQRGGLGWIPGGMGTITQAMARAVESFGATVRINAEVVQISVKNGKAVGVVLKDGEEIRGKAMASNADPKRTFLTLVEPQHLEDDFLKRVRRIRMEGVIFKAELVLDGLPNYKCYPGTEPGPQHRALIRICPSLEYLEKAWDDMKYGRPSQNPYLTCFIQTVHDDSLAPPGKHIMGIYAQYTPYHLKDSSWEVERDKFGNRVIDILAEYAPNIKDIIVDHKFLSPLDLEERLYMTYGHMFQGEVAPGQIFSFRPLTGWSNYRTPIANLYLCGAGAYPGGTVTGAPGHNAAHEILKDWREGTIG